MNNSPKSRAIKEHAGRNCLIREDNYNTSLEKIKRLADEARKDFPHLLDKDLTLKMYGGDCIKLQIGIEFNVDEEAIPAEYRKISELPPVL